MTNPINKKARTCKECGSLLESGDSLTSRGRPRISKRYCSAKCGSLAKAKRIENNEWLQLQVKEAYPRRKLALNLRNEGKTFKEIGEELRVSKTQAWKIVSAAKRMITKQGLIE